MLLTTTRTLSPSPGPPPPIPSSKKSPAFVCELLTQDTSKELQKATGWQPHSVRGFLSGTIGKKMGLTLTSTKGEDGERSYSIKA
jgi:hypothetical protein